MKIGKNKLVAIAIIIVLVIIAYVERRAISDIIYLIQKAGLPKEITLNQTSDSTEREIKKSVTGRSNNLNKLIVDVIGEEINLAVPFTSQAPFTKWDEIHEETCEEASELMVDAYFNHKKFTPEFADEQLLKLNEWEALNIGEYMNTNTEQAAQVLTDYFHFSDVTIKNITSLDQFLETIIDALNNNKLLVMPAAGQLLYNPNFTPPGPVYHMLVIKGYTKDKNIITNDPGTRRGHNYVYSLTTLFNALHDWNNGKTELGKKIVIIVGK